MGMDVIGKEPVGHVGEYFRRNVWWWRPLAEYVCRVAPDIAAGCNYWYSNDGEGLDANASRRLAAVLRCELQSGRTAEYSLQRAEWIASLKLVDCRMCNVKGRRLPPSDGGPGICCPGCDG